MLHLLISFCWLPWVQAPGAEAIDAWKVFAAVPFKPTYFARYKEYFLVPQFGADIRMLEGKTITLKGYYLPYETAQPGAVIISRYPVSACFFCGGAGPESVAEVVFDTRAPRLKADQIVTVSGKLRLNDTDVNRLNFILEHATLTASER